MAVFVADGAEGAVIVLPGQFCQGTVAVDQIGLVAALNGDGFAIDSLLAVLQVFAHPPLVGPDGIASATIVHALAGIDDEQLVDVAVVIPVVEAPVDVECFQYFHDVLDQILRILVILLGAGILLGIAADLHIHQVEDDVELAIALGMEIVVDGALKRFLCQVLGIENQVPLF